jgi:hypothetical protein
MKSVRSTTGLGSGAGVVVLCRFPVTLLLQSRGFRQLKRSTTGPGAPPAPSPTLVPLLPFSERTAHRGCRGSRAATAVVRVGPFNGAGEGEGAGAIAPVRNLHSTTIPRRMASPVELCMKSMCSTTGLGSGAGVVVLCSFPVTLPAQSRRFGAGAAQTAGSGGPQPPSPSPSLRRLPSRAPSKAAGAQRPRAESRQPSSNRPSSATAPTPWRQPPPRPARAPRSPPRAS